MYLTLAIYKGCYMRRLLILLLTTVCINNTMASAAGIQPEASTGVGKTQLVYGKSQMIVTNSFFATQAAQNILNQGGNAVDAAIAASFVLGLTEPQSSGIGGGGYALTYNAKNKKMFAYDGREVAPKSANPDWFLHENGQPFSFEEAMLSPKSVGVPSLVAFLATLHKDQGKLAWAKLLQPAIDLATNGFPMGHRLHGLLAMENDNGTLNGPEIKSVYFDGNKPKPVNAVVINIDYANTLKQIAKNPNSFYHGAIAGDIVDTLNTVAKQKLYTKTDLTAYKVQRYNGVCAMYRNKYQVCSVPPSTSGGVTALELLKIYSNNYNGNNPDDLNWVYNFAEASKLAYADRNQYLADPKFVKQPIMGLLDDDYIKSRSKLVTDVALNTPVSAGIPAGIDKRYAPDLEPKAHGTTSLVIVDKQGNTVTMTNTVEHQFGSHIFVDGFFLNNELTDFAFIPNGKSGRPVANRVESKKRSRSSITPVIVFDEKRNVYLVTGSPGGSPIICYVAKNIIQVLDFKMNAAAAIASPNLCAVNGPLILEEDSDLASAKSKLSRKGENVEIKPLVSGVTSIMRAESGGWYGAADPRREGVALGN